MSSTVSIVIAVISFAGTVTAAGLAWWLTNYSDKRKRRAATNKLLAKYRDPLLLAAYDLQSRICNLVRNQSWGYLGSRGDYLRSHTCFLVGQYFAWIYILRREAQFTCFDTESENRVLADQLRAIEDEWSSSLHRSIWELWRGQQIGIGELLTVEEGKSGQLNCMGYVAFMSKWNDEEFKGWFSDILTDINSMYAHYARTRAPTTEGAHANIDDGRLHRLQNLLVDLMVILDKKGVQRPSHRRKLDADKKDGSWAQWKTPPMKKSGILRDYRNKLGFSLIPLEMTDP